VAIRVHPSTFDPTRYEAFRFLSRSIDEDGTISLHYALDEEIEFVERFELPQGTLVSDDDRERVDGILTLLHLLAGVSYYKAAVPPSIESEPLPPAVARLLEAIYSEGLGEFAFTNELDRLPNPAFPALLKAEVSTPEPRSLERVLVPIGGGKDSAVALEIVRRSGFDLSLFSVGDAGPISRTAAVAGLPHLIVRRKLDPMIGDLNRAGALNGHVPITAIVSCVAILTAALHQFDAVAMANERSASKGNVRWGGIDVNHQFSKSIRAEGLMRSALATVGAGVDYFSVLRPASELGIAKAFTQLTAYHQAFSSCNTNFRLDGSVPSDRWCCDCPKCRFVFLVMAPFSEPDHMREIFGADMLEDESQFEGFALLTATGGFKPFECVGEEEESKAAIGMLAADPRWRDHRIVRRLAEEVLTGSPEVEAALAAQALELSDEHSVPPELMASVRAVLGS
jgi:UDP-N-acetyl-alpha-D-muramoyl-L-alanyl-L-glutamate epimerase